jgi:hypothetical protein
MPRRWEQIVNESLTSNVLHSRTPHFVCHANDPPGRLAKGPGLLAKGNARARLAPASLARLDLARKAGVDYAP